MAETTYYDNKVYLPREVRGKLGLVNGDILHIDVERGTATLKVVRRCGAAKRALEKLDNPPDMGVIKGKLSREETY